MAITLKEIIIGVEVNTAGTNLVDIDDWWFGGIAGNYFDDDGKKSYYWPDAGNDRVALRMPEAMAEEFEGVEIDHIGGAAPATPAALMVWYDTTANRFKVRNAGNTAWTTIAATQKYGVPDTATDINFPTVDSIITQK